MRTVSPARGQAKAARVCTVDLLSIYSRSHVRPSFEASVAMVPMDGARSSMGRYRPPCDEINKQLFRVSTIVTLGDGQG
jgi:hypothetical protein